MNQKEQGWLRMEKIHMDYKWQISKSYAFADTEPIAGFQCHAILE